MRFCLVGLFMALACVAGADTLDKITLPVEGRGEQQRQTALRKGLDAMLVRLTGKTALAGGTLADLTANQLDRWVERYHYQGDNTLVAHYDTQGLIRFLGSRGEPVWSLPRPRVLLWLVIQGAGRGEMLSAEHPLHETLEDAARRRGLKLVFPRWDGQDQSVLSVADVRGRFDERLRQASRRYSHELVVPAVLYPGNPATVSWRILRGDETLEKGREQRGNHQKALITLVNRLTSQLAERYTLTTNGNRQQTRLLVENVGSLADWQQLQTFLDNLSGMRQARLTRVSDTSATFVLDFLAGDAQLRRLLALSDKLRACPKGTVAGLQWHYCWQP